MSVGVLLVIPRGAPKPKGAKATKCENCKTGLWLNHLARRALKFGVTTVCNACVEGRNASRT